MYSLKFGQKDTAYEDFYKKKQVPDLLRSM